MTLYDLLGVGPEATDKQIRAAYRRKAKAAHPDAGGDPAAFERLKFAHDLLLDEERRRRYDETGEEVPGRPDNALAEALDVIAGALAAAVASAVDVKVTDMATDLCRFIRQQLAKVAEEREKVERQQARATEMLARFKAPGGEADHVGAVLRGRIAELAAPLRELQRAERARVRAIEMLERYGYDAAREAPTQWPQQSWRALFQNSTT